MERLKVWKARHRMWKLVLCSVDIVDILCVNFVILLMSLVIPYASHIQGDY